MKCFTEYMKVNWESKKAVLPTGITMAYAECGPADGIPMILIHGVTDARVSWSQVAPMMAERGYHIWVPEYRGNGLTDKPDPGPEGYLAEMHARDIVALMDVLGIEKAHIVGHSLGSIICQIINIWNPGRVLSTTLQDSTVRCMPNEVLEWAEKGDGGEYLGVHGYDEAQAMPDSFLVGWTENGNECADFQAATLEHVRQMPYPVWAWLIEGLNAFDNRKYIHLVSGKVLVMWGSEDAIFPQKDQDELRAGLTGCDVTWKILEGGSHNFHWDGLAAREWFVETLDAYIKAL